MFQLYIESMAAALCHIFHFSWTTIKLRWEFSFDVQLTKQIKVGREEKSFLLQHRDFQHLAAAGDEVLMT